MWSDREVEFTEADIESSTKEQENTNVKKESSHNLKQFNEFLAKSRQSKGEIFKKFQPPSCKSLHIEGLSFRFTAGFTSVVFVYITQRTLHV